MNCWNIGNVINKYVSYFFISTSIVLSGILYSFEFTSFIYSKEIGLSLCIIFLLPFLTKKEAGRLDLRFLLVYVLFLVSSFFNLFFAQVPEMTLIKLGELSLAFLSCMGIFVYYEDTSFEKCLFWSIWISGMAVALLTLFQYLELIPVMFPIFSHYNQVYSVMGNQILVGGYLAMCSLWILERYEKLNIDYHWIGIFLIFSVLGLLITRSRSAWLAFFLPYLFISWREIKEKSFRKSHLISLLLILVSVIIAIPLIYKRIVNSFTLQDTGFWIRMWIYDGTVRMLVDKFPYGIGLGNYYYYSPLYLGISAQSNSKFFDYCNEILTFHTECDFLELFVELGLLGILVSLVFYFWWFLNGRGNSVWMSYVILSVLNSVLWSTPHLYLALLSLMRNEENNWVIKICGVGWKWFRRIYVLLFMLNSTFLTMYIWLPDYGLRQAEKKLLLGVNCIEDYEKLLSFPFAPVGTYEGLGKAYIQSGNYKDAYDLLLSSLSVLDSGTVYILLGRCAYQLGKEEDALKWYREALRRFPKNQEAKNFLSKFEAPSGSSEF